MNTSFLKENPYYLSDEDIAWCEGVLSRMSPEEKTGQMIFPRGAGLDSDSLREMTQKYHVGGLMFRPLDAALKQSLHRQLQNFADIPLLLAANNECGAGGTCVQGTSFGSQMAAAATGDPENVYRMSLVAAEEGKAVGFNWNFAPVTDIDFNWHNPITNVRTYGSDPKMTEECASAFLRAAKDAGIAVSVKHFPGDGCDERDQHNLTTINSLSTEEWDNTYGRIYSRLIAEGAQTFMIGHIAQPAYAEKINPSADAYRKLLPASLSDELLNGLLRGKLGFNGVIVTDATLMMGYTTAMKRSDALVQSILAGCDMILFTKNLEEDYRTVLDAVNSGRIPMARADEAVLRILGLKASLGLHKKAKEDLVPSEEALSIIGCEKHLAWAKECADAGVTLVKDTQHLLPLDTQKYRSICLNVIRHQPMKDDPMLKEWQERFEKEGFKVTVQDRSVNFTGRNLQGLDLDEKTSAVYHQIYADVEETLSEADLFVYIAFVENASCNVVTRLSWTGKFGITNDAPWMVHEKPVLFISLANPYHLFDIPFIRTMINAYANTPAVGDAVMDKLMGRSEFRGVSPVDPACGDPYLKLAMEL